MPQNVDMDLIREALLRRREGGGAPMGGDGMPAISQTTLPTGETPQGGPNTPIQPTEVPPGSMPQGGSSPMPPKARNEAMKTSQEAQSPQFDDETRIAAKTLLQKLLKYL